MRENSYVQYIDADNFSFHSEQKTEVTKINSINSFPWKIQISHDEVIYDFDSIEFLSNSQQVQLIFNIKGFLLDDKKIRFVNLKKGLVPDFLYWIQ
ncbi:MAG: hypothetical protein ACK5D5_10815 [Bacteroidota bacterium]|jgi:hypothetical protein